MESGELRGPGVEAASQDDAAWFEDHPGRQLRLRNRIAGEYEVHQVALPPPGLTPRTLVLQLQSGVRSRHPVAIYADVDNDTVTDAQLYAFLDEIAPLEVKEMLARVRKAKLPGKPNPAPRGRR